MLRLECDADDGCIDTQRLEPWVEESRSVRAGRQVRDREAPLRIGRGTEQSAFARSALADHLHDQEQLRIAAGNYIKMFPWDLDAEMAYAGSLTAALEGDQSLPADTREQLKRELFRTGNFLRVLDVTDQEHERIQRVETVLKQG